MNDTKISVVVPCFNEEQNIRKNLKKMNEYLASRFDRYELIVVNDGSQDSTKEELFKLQREINLKIINNSENQGKGEAVKGGMLASGEECGLVMFLDSDLGIPVEELEKFMPEIENGYDIVIGSRFVPGFKTVRPVQFHRRIMEKIFRRIRMAIVNNRDVKDTQCGFKVFRREAAMKIFPKLTVKRFAFDAEVIYVANKHKLKIKELPITLQNPPDSHIRLVRDPLNMAWDLLRIRMHYWRGRYE